MTETQTPAEYINKKQLCKTLNISPHTAQKELDKAIQEVSGIVIKIGKTFRINFNKFIECNNSNNKKQLEEKEKWEEKEIKKSFTNEMAFIGLTTMTEADIAVSNQLRQRILKGR